VSETSAAHTLASPSIFAVAIRRPQACEWNSRPPRWNPHEILRRFWPVYFREAGSY